MPASNTVKVHFFREIQKSFPRTTTNKPFLRPCQRILAVKNIRMARYEPSCILSLGPEKEPDNIQEECSVHFTISFHAHGALWPNSKSLSKSCHLVAENYLWGSVHQFFSFMTSSILTLQPCNAFQAGCQVLSCWLCIWIYCTLSSTFNKVTLIISYKVWVLRHIVTTTLHDGARTKLKKNPP